MPLFTRKPKAETAAQVLAGLNPLEAVACVAEEVESGIDNLGLVQVRRKYRPARGVLGLAGRAMGYRYERRVNLDARGSFLWLQIDGQRDAATIAEALAAKFDIEPAAAREATILYLRDLLTRHLILLRFPERSENPRPAHG